MEVKKILREIYSIDYSKITLADGAEFITNKQGFNEFTSYLKLYDINSGIILIPSEYINGLFYNSEDGGSLFAAPSLDPDITKFNFTIMGLKKNAYYRIRVIGKTTGDNFSITDNRKISIVDNSNALILDYDFSNDYEYTNVDRIFCCTNAETVLKFQLGKISIKNIVIDEIEVIDNSVNDTEIQDINGITLSSGYDKVAAFGYFNIELPTSDLRYIQIPRLSGYGIVLTYDNVDKVFIIERDNQNETIVEPLTSLKYYLELNDTRLNDYSRPQIHAENTFSPTTLKQGYYKLKFERQIHGILLVKIKAVI